MTGFGFQVSGLWLTFSQANLTPDPCPTMSLAETLRRLREHSAEKNPTLAELVDRSTRELRESGTLERVLKVELLGGIRSDP